MKRGLTTLRQTRDRGKQVGEPVERTVELIASLIDVSSQVLVKKLANNDRNWSVWNARKGRYLSNQAGPLLPDEVRRRRFFPRLAKHKGRRHPAAPVTIVWPTTGKSYGSWFTWFKDKGNAENHLTRHPYDEFARLSPASYLLVFKPRRRAEPYRALTVDAVDDEQVMSHIADVFGIGPDFGCRIFNAGDLDPPALGGEADGFIRDLVAAMARGPDALRQLAARSSTRLKTDRLATEAARQWMADRGLAAINLFERPCPGDDFLDLITQYEFRLRRQLEAEVYGTTLARKLLRNGKDTTASQSAEALVRRFATVYMTCLSAKQSRSQGIGRTFENHLERALRAGGIPFSKQAILNGRAPDFILPSAAAYKKGGRNRSVHSLVLALKTTLRERWAQVISEAPGCPVYLATLDESVSGQVLGKLAKHRITLVVPERFKTSAYSEYASRRGVITFRQLFDQLSTRVNGWKHAGLMH